MFKEFKDIEQERIEREKKAIVSQLQNIVTENGYEFEEVMIFDSYYDDDATIVTIYDLIKPIKTNEIVTVRPTYKLNRDGTKTIIKG